MKQRKIVRLNRGEGDGELERGGRKLLLKARERSAMKQIKTLAQTCLNTPTVKVPLYPQS